MLQELIWLTAIVPTAAMFIAYARSRDSFHPLVFIAPMFVYVYAFRPAVFFYRGLIDDRFNDVDQVGLAQLVHLLGIAAFCIGCLWVRVAPGIHRMVRTPVQLTEPARRKLAVLSLVIAIFGIASYALTLYTRGGFAESYNRPKGGGASGMSGYITSAPLLTIPATLMYLLSQRGRPLTWNTLLTVLLYVSPHLIQGSLGGSRGALFLTAITILASWYISRAERPPLKLMVTGLAVLGLSMMLLQAHRRNIYLGSDFQFESIPVTEILMPTKLTLSDATTYSWGLILVSRYHHVHYWGLRYLTQVIIRPIPRQIWPTKYEDVGMDWMVKLPGSGGFTFNQWRQAIGWFPESGSSTGFIADAYLEFAWGMLAVAFLVGLLYGYLWKKAVIEKGVWTIIYFEAAVVSVYLTTQGLSSAWGYRLIFLTVPTWLVWRFVIEPLQAKGVVSPWPHRLPPGITPPP